jgi:sterol desaturase/sphingolipid hydroxylase (fatty acid hydroxylase superfamily)
MLDPLLVSVLAMFAAFSALDLAFAARSFPTVRRWRTKGVAATALYFGLAYFLPGFWDERLAGGRLVNASGLPFWVQVGVGFVVLQLGTYLWHRALHTVPFLWRHFHQMHHSAERVDIWGAFYFHPLDVVGFTFLGSLCLVGGFGISADAAVAVTIGAAFCSMFQHANLATPHWLGFLVTRPESHALHHQRGVHGFNYGDIPIFDMLLGTFRNPVSWHGEAGFFDGASSHLGALLIGRELS